MIALVKQVEVQCMFSGSDTGDDVVQWFLTFSEGGAFREPKESSLLSAQKIQL